MTAQGEHWHLLARFPEVASRDPRLLVLETAVTAMFILVCVRLFAFLRAMRTPVSLSKGMLWLFAALGTFTMARVVRYGAVWMGATDTGLLARLPAWSAFLGLLWFPVYLVDTFQVIVRKETTASHSVRAVRRAEICCAALVSLLSLKAWALGITTMAAVLCLLGIATNTVIAFLFVVRQGRLHTKFAAQAMCLLLVATILPVAACWASLYTQSGGAIPVVLYRFTVDMGASILTTGCLVIFSNSRFADVLLSDVLNIYWTGYTALLALLGCEFLLEVSHNRSFLLSSLCQALCLVWVLLSIAALLRGGDALDRILSNWLFDKPDYDYLLKTMCTVAMQGESEAVWFEHIVRDLCDKAGFAAACVVHLSMCTVDVAMLRRPGEQEFFPATGDPLRNFTEPATEVLLPVRVQDEIPYALAIAPSPLRGELLQVEVVFLRRFVRQMEERLELRRSASLQREREQHEERLRSQLTEAELRALRTQIQPHFLFNSLNTIAHLCIAEPAQAESMTTMLANIFRYVLTSTNDPFITLGDEIYFMENYLAIEQMRFGDRLSIELAVQPSTRGLRVPPLLLQPLIENAIRHGLAPQISGGLIRLSAWCTGATLEIVVEDTGVGLRQAGQDCGTTRVGLANIRKRLECHYGKAASLHLSERKGGGVRASISLPREAGLGLPA